MHKPLAVSLQLGGTAVGRGHQGKIGIHARIPATVADNALLGFEIADIEALAGGTHKGARAAAETGLGKSLPLGSLKQFVEVFTLETGQVELRKRQFSIISLVFSCCSFTCLSPPSSNNSETEAVSAFPFSVFARQ